MSVRKNNGTEDSVTFNGVKCTPIIWDKIFAEVQEKPLFINRENDYLMLAKVHFIESLLSAYTFTADRHIDADSFVTLSLNELNLAENDKTEDETKRKLAASILEYAEDFYNDFNYWGAAQNLKGDIPYIMKALILDDVDKIAECIKCQDSRN